MRIWRTTAVAVLIGIAYVVLLGSDRLSASVVDLVGEGGQALAAAIATVGCLVAWRRTYGHRRLAWGFVAAGTASWTAGQLIWTWYEIGLHRSVPFPSPADVGYLAFPLLSGFGLLMWLGTSSDRMAARGRDVLDGAIVAGSLLVLSWVTALGTVVGAGPGDGWFAFALSLAYPLGDVVVVTLAVMALSRGGDEDRAPLWVLTIGLVGVAASDSAFVYLTSTSSYTSGSFTSGGWMLGFLLVGVAGCSVRRTAGGHLRVEPATTDLATRLQLVLPYVPLSAALGIIAVDVARGAGASHGVLLAGFLLVAMVLLRQFLTVMDNHRLVSALAVARDQLEHRTLHDALTGLPNRVLFADRLEQALTGQRSGVTVLFCDLDDFKPVNDRFGHEAGDRLLVEVARRLTSCVRSGDTVARLGGDEFAVLLADDACATDVADRIVNAMSYGVELDGDVVVVSSISIGVARHEEPTASRTARAEAAAAAAGLVRRADAAMYAAKASGKGRVVLAELSVVA